jgi:hypothetical protein
MIPSWYRGNNHPGFGVFHCGQIAPPPMQTIIDIQQELNDWA